jgi:hypothetical protein
MDVFDSGNLLRLIGGAFIQRLPEFLVIFAGLAFCFFNRKKSPAASRPALAGLIVLLIINITGIFLPVLFTQMARSFQGNLTTYEIISVGVGFAFSLVGSIGLGLIIYAVWTGRKTTD